MDESFRAGQCGSCCICQTCVAVIASHLGECMWILVYNWCLQRLCCLLSWYYWVHWDRTPWGQTSTAISFEGSGPQMNWELFSSSYSHFGLVQNRPILMVTCFFSMMLSVWVIYSKYVIAVLMFSFSFSTCPKSPTPLVLSLSYSFAIVAYLITI